MAEQRCPKMKWRKHVADDNLTFKKSRIKKHHQARKQYAKLANKFRGERLKKP